MPHLIKIILRPVPVTELHLISFSFLIHQLTK